MIDRDPASEKGGSEWPLGICPPAGWNGQRIIIMIGMIVMRCYEHEQQYTYTIMILL